MGHNVLVLTDEGSNVRVPGDGGPVQVTLSQAGEYAVERSADWEGEGRTVKFLALGQSFGRLTFSVSLLMEIISRTGRISGVVTRSHVPDFSAGESAPLARSLSRRRADWGGVDDVVVIGNRRRALEFVSSFPDSARLAADLMANEFTEFTLPAV